MASDMIVIVVTWCTLRRERSLMKTLGRRTLSDVLFVNGRMPLTLFMADHSNVCFILGMVYFV